MRACLRRSSPSRFRTCSPRAAGHRANKLCLRDHRLGGDCAYDISKAGLNMLSDHIAVEYGPQGIVDEVITDEGLVGVGETDLNAWVARAFIEAPATHTMDRGLKEQLIGRDPLDPEAIWEDLYVGTAMTGRRGGGINAIGALDIAVWDICGQAAGKPCWQLWSEDGRESLTPYASLQPEVTSFGAYTDAMVGWGLRAKELCFRAAKCEATFSGPYVHKGLHGNDAKIIDVVTAVREAVGPEMALMVDVQYAFDSVDRALRCCDALAELDVFFLETPLWADDLAAYAELQGRTSV